LPFTCNVYRYAADLATDHELHMGHDGRLTNTGAVMEMETHKWVGSAALSRLRSSLLTLLLARYNPDKSDIHSLQSKHNLMTASGSM
jgi:hypothetical protein